MSEDILYPEWVIDAALSNAEMLCFVPVEHDEDGTQATEAWCKENKETLERIKKL